VVVLANSAVGIEDVALQLMGTIDLVLSNLLFVFTAMTFLFLLAVLLAAQEKRRVRTTWVVGILWLLLAVPLALVHVGISQPPVRLPRPCPCKSI
jgi:ABC-type microcin C transport system permease subunit YejE